MPPAAPQFAEIVRHLPISAEFAGIYTLFGAAVRYNAGWPSYTRETFIMTQTEKDIMRHFRQYHIGMNEMLFFNTHLANSNSPKFHWAMASLIRSGLVIKERRRNAYSLTDVGFVTSLSA